MTSATLAQRHSLVTVVALAVGGLALVASMALALGIGPVAVPVRDVLEVVARRLRLGDYPVSVLHDQIVWQLRLPRVVGAAAVGAGLAICGAVLQSLTRNALADPYLLGISGGASVGAVTVIVLGVSIAGLVGTAAVAAAGFVGALGSLALVLLLAAGRGGALPPTRTVLAGVAVGQACAAYTSFLILVSGDSDAARRVLDWTLGSVAGVRWSTAMVLAGVSLIALVVLSAAARSLDALAFGDVAAGSLGVDVNRLRWGLMVLTALVTAVLVAYAGAIGFVGLVVPHLVRLLAGPGHRLLLPMSALVGAIVLVWADTLARTIVDGREIPVGVVTGIIGTPVFAVLLRRESLR